MGTDRAEELLALLAAAKTAGFDPSNPTFPGGSGSPSNGTIVVPLTNPSFENPITPAVSVPVGGWDIYQHDPDNPGEVPFTTFERSNAWASDGRYSLHFVSPGDDIRRNFAPINPATWTGEGQAAPNGWWPVATSLAYIFTVDALGVHEADYVLDRQGVSLGIDWYDENFVQISRVRGGERSNVPHVQDGVAVTGISVTGQAPANAVWAVPFVICWQGSDYVEAYIDNVSFTAVAGSPQIPVFSPGAAPLSASPYSAGGAYWSTSANYGRGGWVLDTVSKLHIHFHSSSDANDIQQAVPSQTLKASWIGQSEFFADRDQLGARTGIFGYVDHIPAGGHAGLHIGIPGAPFGAFPFHTTFAPFSMYGVARLDGTAACVIPAVVSTALSAAALNASSNTVYNADSTMLDYASATILGTDLTADSTNNQIHTTAGGMFYIWGSFDIEALRDDFPTPFS